MINNLEEMQDLHIGQSYDLYWTRNTICPTEEEYLEMVEKSKYLLRLRKFLRSLLTDENRNWRSFQTSDEAFTRTSDSTKSL